MNRRSILAGTPLAVVAVAMPSATLGQMSSDQQLVAACARYFELNRHFAAYGDRDIYPDDPALIELSAVTDRIARLRAFTLEGSKARAAVIVCHTPCVMHDNAFAPESADMIKALLRDLAGGAA